MARDNPKNQAAHKRELAKEKRGLLQRERTALEKGRLYGEDWECISSCASPDVLGAVHISKASKYPRK